MFIYETGQVARPRSRARFKTHHPSSQLYMLCCVNRKFLLYLFFLSLSGTGKIYASARPHSRSTLLGWQGKTAARLIQCLLGNNKSGDRTKLIFYNGVREEHPPAAVTAVQGNGEQRTKWIWNCGCQECSVQLYSYTSARVDISSSQMQYQT